MRARGAKVTDLAVIVVAADDGVMPQTVEAIDHAKAAGVPILVAVNKIDRPDAQPDRVRNELASQGLNPEEWGGETIFVDVSAKTKEGLDTLLEMIGLAAELEELKANPTAPASGIVIESHLDPGRARWRRACPAWHASVGDAVVAGAPGARSARCSTSRATRIEEAGPGDPVEVLGLEGVAEAGERFEVVPNERRARQLAEEREPPSEDRVAGPPAGSHHQPRGGLQQGQAGRGQGAEDRSEGRRVGSLEALQDEIAQAAPGAIAVDVIHAAAGGITESDVMLAAASDAIIIGFNVRPLADARRAAEREGVEIRTYSVIYKVDRGAPRRAEGMLEPEEVEERSARPRSRSSSGHRASARSPAAKVTDGKITRTAQVRLVREGTVVWTGRIGSLRRFKDNVQEVEEGLECGVVLEGYQDVKVGDVLELFETQQVEQTLE